MASPDGVTELPHGGPVPEDDGAAGHLEGMELPSVPLASTSGDAVDLSSLAGLTVVFCYPMTGGPDGSVPVGWDEIPGARGCTSQACSFRDHHGELASLGAGVYGVSAQDTDYQVEASERLHLPYDLLSDEDLALAGALGLPTFEADGMVLLKRLTMILHDGRVEKAFYPVFPPDRSADEVIAWLSVRAQSQLEE